MKNPRKFAQGIALAFRDYLAGWSGIINDAQADHFAEWICDIVETRLNQLQVEGREEAETAAAENGFHQRNDGEPSSRSGLAFTHSRRGEP